MKVVGTERVLSWKGVKKEGTHEIDRERERECVCVCCWCVLYVWLDCFVCFPDDQNYLEDKTERQKRLRERERERERIELDCELNFNLSFFLCIHVPSLLPMKN
jgi:putative lipase involved disintegration of autophagic bodies